MSQTKEKRSFFSTIPGLVTGLAGLLTGVVGLITALVQLGVLGGDDTKDPVAGNTGTSVVAPAPGSGAGGTPAPGGAAEIPKFSVSPIALDFKATEPRDKEVTVKNTSETATLTLSTPRITGRDAARFSASAGSCGALRAGESCRLRVTFAPSGPLANYEATLHVTGTNARVEEIRLTGSTLLLGS